MIDFYTWTTPNGKKISIMLEETGLDYEVHTVDINNNEQFHPDFMKISPNNKIPAIVDQTQGIKLFESGAILLYLSQKSNLFLPEGKDYWKMMQWLMWQMGGLGPTLGQAHHFLHYHPKASKYSSNRFYKEVKRLYSVLERQLDEQKFLIQEYSIVDIAVWPWVSRFVRHQIQLTDYPNIKRWYIEIASRKAVQKGYDVPYGGEKIPIPD